MRRKKDIFPFRIKKNENAVRNSSADGLALLALRTSRRTESLRVKPRETLREAYIRRVQYVNTMPMAVCITTQNGG